MTNEEILRIAMEQSAVDANCLAEDFVKTENKIVYSKERPDARFPTGPILWRPSVKSMRGLSGIT